MRISAALQPKRLWQWVMGPAPGGAQGGSADRYLWRNARTIARARLLLAFGNALVIYLDPTEPPSTDWHVLAAAYGTIFLIIAYALWVWRLENSKAPPEYLPRLATWLDVVCGAALIASTGAHRSPFYMWTVFTIVGSALKSGWRSAVRVAVAQIALYILICLPYLGRTDLRLSVFLVRTTYLFVIALVLAYMGQRLLEHSRILAGLQAAACHMSAARTAREIVGGAADSLTDLLAGAVVAAPWEERGEQARPVLVNLDPNQGLGLLRLARACIGSPRETEIPSTVISNSPGDDPCFVSSGDALAGIRNLLITRLPGRGEQPGVLVACNRQDQPGFTREDAEVAELLAALVGSLLRTARLQEQRRYHAGVDERRRIAAELHDGLIQTLASINLRALACGDLSRGRRWEMLDEELILIQLLAEEALSEARGAINELAPVRLREEGLAVYVEEALRRFQERTSVPVEASIRLTGNPIPEPTALLIIGLLREGLNNIRKHAQTTRVTFVLEELEEEIAFRLADDGTGFNSDESSALREPTRHYGLAYLRERVTALAGEMRVTSRPGEGTVLQARVPLLTEELLISLLSQTGEPPPAAP